MPIKTKSGDVKIINDKGTIFTVKVDPRENPIVEFYHDGQWLTKHTVSMLKAYYSTDKKMWLSNDKPNMYITLKNVEEVVWHALGKKVIK